MAMVESEGDKQGQIKVVAKKAMLHKKIKVIKKLEKKQCCTIANHCALH